ncbi:hypothetical protein [Ruficoccus sp. ZRK36]|uniref:hypothetical protein n=1 Tax=Ruficoccus sp. ZRK36 TaxID=2866311 RepID=UPI001C736757|nr:hypothetical protein [Ruficoccus sp. ZRK36]QYY37171.1 hypothetical protein K0V07_06725 [Ruficoccus sp. ZRK36]
MKSLLSLSLIALLASSASADMLQLRDGTVHNGTYAGGTIASVRFEIGSDIKTFPVSQVAAITFGGSGPVTTSSAVAADSAVPVSESTSVDTSSSSSAASGTIQAGTPLVVSLGQELDSKNAQEGQVFTGTLVSPLTIGDKVVAPAGSKVEGKVVEVRQARRVLGRNASLSFTLTRITVGSQQYAISTSAQSESRRGQGMIGEAAKGAATGATWGAIADDDNVGNDALAGMATSAVSGVLRKPEQVVYQQGAILSFDLTSPLELK